MAKALGVAFVVMAVLGFGVAGAFVGAEAASDTTGTFYVSTAGSDANAGTEDSPWRTIEHGLTQLRPGETLYVRGGTYVENIRGPRIREGRPDARITVAAYPGERPVIQGLLWLTRPSHWTLDGINVTWHPDNDDRSHMVKLTRGVGWVFENAEVWGARSLAGILVYGYGDGEPSDWAIRGNCIHDVWSPDHSANKDHNLYINTGVTAGAGLVEHNLLFDAPNGQNVKLGYGGGGQPGDGTSNVIVRYNTMATSLRPLLVADESSNNVIERNIIVEGSENYAIRAYELSGTNNVFRDNVFGSFDYLQFGDPGYELLTDGGGNLLQHDPALDGIGCDRMRPGDPTSQSYGRYAPN